MSFTTVTFVIFVVVALCIYWLVCNRNVKVQNAFLVAASYVFYGWTDWKMCLILTAFSAIVYTAGCLIGQYRETDKKKAKFFSTLNIILGVGILWLFKYYDFFAGEFAKVFLNGQSDKFLLHLILPIGLSFYILRGLSYTIDIYQGKIEAEKDAIKVFAYISFFPQILSGPIARPTDMLPQLSHARVFSYEWGTDGMRQILWGLFKKVVVADNCAAFVDLVFSDISSQTGSTLALTAILYSIQIYADFSGYSDMAIGIGKLFGFTSKKNFDYPYFSRNIAEFWRKWHISLTSWFRDYVYIPLGGSRVPKGSVVINTFVIFLLSGLWHGANWTFFLWGGIHAALFVPLIFTGASKKYKGTAVADNKALPTVIELSQMLLTFALATIAWIMFRADSVGQFFEIMKGIIDPSLFTKPTANGLTGLMLCIIILAIVEWTMRKKEHGLEISCIRHALIRYCIYLLILFLIFAFGGNAVNFVYFQF